MTAHQTWDMQALIDLAFAAIGPNAFLDPRRRGTGSQGPFRRDPAGPAKAMQPMDALAAAALARRRPRSPRGMDQSTVQPAGRLRCRAASG